MKQKKRYSSINYSKLNLRGYFKSFSKIFLIALIIAISIQGFNFSKDYYHTYISFKHDFFQNENILATSTGPVEVTVDFSKQISTGSPLIFGGAHMPSLEHQDAWDKIEDVGVTIIRRDIFIENEVPQDITLEDYKNNNNDVQNPDNWNQERINFTNTVYKNAKDRGIKVNSIFAYAPLWLTFTGTSKGVPRDWEVYEDVVKKVYMLHKEYIDYIEIWNEPNLLDFLDTTGSGLTRQEAYVQIYYHAHKAIREAEEELKETRNIPIGASVGHDPIDTSVLEALLENPKTKNSFDFISYHNYEHLPEPSWGNYKNLLKDHKKENIPIYLTEWNYKGTNDENLFYRSGEGALTYTANKFIDYLNMGLKMANYYALIDVHRPKYENDDPSYGFYKWENGSAELLPQTKTWRLMSKTLGLGEGESRIFDAESEDEIESVGFINSKSDRGVILVNNTDSDAYVSVNIKNFNSNNNKIPFYVYIASSKYDGSQPVDKFYLPRNKDKIYKITLLLPAQSVEALLVPENYDWKDTLRSYFP